MHGELGGGGGEGGRRGPIHRENEPPFRRKRLPKFFCTASGRGRPHVQVMDVRAQIHGSVNRGFQTVEIPDEAEVKLRLIKER